MVAVAVSLSRFKFRARFAWWSAAGGLLNYYDFFPEKSARVRLGLLFIENGSLVRRPKPKQPEHFLVVDY